MHVHVVIYSCILPASTFGSPVANVRDLVVWVGHVMCVKVWVCTQLCGVCVCFPVFFCMIFNPTSASCPDVVLAPNGSFLVRHSTGDEQNLTLSLRAAVVSESLAASLGTVTVYLKQPLILSLRVAGVNELLAD